MSPSRSLRWIKRFFWVGVSVAASVAAVGYVRWAMKIDPFAQFRPTNLDEESRRVGIRLEDVSVQSWSEGKISLTCRVGRVDVMRDRQHLEFHDVTDGVFRGESGAFHFAGPIARYNAGFQLLEVDKGVRVWNKNLDLTADGINYRQKIDKLATQGMVKGRFFGGQIEAMGLMYYPETELWEAGPIAWNGKLGKDIQDVATSETNKPWSVKARFGKRLGDNEIYTEGEATDGEVIVKAPNIERNVKTDVLTCTGGVQYFSKRANLACERVTVYRKEKRAVLSGHVTMLIKPKDQEKLEVVEIQPFRPLVPADIAATRPPAPPTKTEQEKKQDEELRSSKSAKKYPTTVTADTIEYWYKRGERRAVITGNPQARQEFPNGRWRHMWTFRAFYDDEKETLRLDSTSGKKDTRVMTSIGDDLIAVWFLTSTKEDGEDQWEGEGVEGTVISDDDELNNRNQRNPPPANARPPALRGPIGHGRIS